MEKDFYKICRSDSRYPHLLRESYDPPRILFAKGNLSTLNAKRWIAVVGARKASRWGLEKTDEVVREFVGRGFGIVSGLAYGIDAQAHRSALGHQGVTWGVLGSGLDRIYPGQHIPLAKRMSGEGGILTEFSLGVGPNKYHFPQRNRIISGMAEATVIVEASIKSGSLITAQFALDEGREVLVVPPPDDSLHYEGNIKLLEAGATPIGSYTPKPKKAEVVDNFLLPHLQGPCSIDALVQKTGKPVAEILAALTKLESLGKVRKFSGPLWQSL